MTKLAFIGLGNMGAGMCANLVKAGHTVTAFDLSENARQRAQDAGATTHIDIAQTVADAEAVITMLPAGDHVRDVYLGPNGVCSTAKPGTLLIDCSTIAVDDAREISKEANQRGFEMVDAPVSGGTAAADAGTLTFMVGGSDTNFTKASSILSHMGAKIFHAGGSGNGQAAKIANNMLLGISMIGTCEAFNLAQNLGLDAQTFFDIASNASGQCWSMTSYCPEPGPVPTSPANRDYQAGFAVAMMLKDLTLAQTAATTSNTKTPFGANAQTYYKELAEAGHGDLDFSVVMKHLKGDL